MSPHSPSSSSSLAAASLAAPVLAPSTPRPAPARRAKASDGSTSDELARAEVLELTLFADKKDWIEDKIKFLSTLPPIDVVSPEPPHPAIATRAELEAWWIEHDRIETEVDEYDMGDLSRMRLFARDKSKQALSPRDTDLIEITLTTLFAVDRLLHLLRQRRKALTLLGYRLQWEDAVSAALTAQRHIQTDLPTFLTNAAWTPPFFAGSRSRQSAADAASLPTSPSLSSLSSSRSLSLLAASTTSPTPTPSLRSSTRTHLVTLQRSTLSTLAHQLASSLVPASATALDKLIDASPQPLPEAFLDEQDRVEAECGAAAAGLREFLDGLSAQRSQADALAADAASVSARAVAAAGAGGRDALAELRARALPALHSALARLAAPTHPLAPAQRAANTDVRSALGELVAAAQEAVERAEGRARAEERLDEVGRRAQAARERLDGLEERWRALVDAAPHGIVETADISQEEQGGEAALGALEPELRAALTDARAVQPDVARAVVVAREAGVQRERVRAVRGAAEELAALVGGLEERVESEKRRREGRTAAREVLRALERARDRCDEGAQALADEARRSRWTAAAHEVDEAASSPSHVVDDVRLAQGALLAPALARAHALAAAGRPPPLASPAAELVAAVRDDTTAALGPLERLCANALAQKVAVRALDGELGVIEGDLARLADEAEALHDRPGSPLSPLEERLGQCAASLERLASSAHAHVPLLAGPTPAAGRLESPFDLAEQDAAVRSYVNERCARASGLADEVRRSVREVEHAREAGEWDEAAERLEREVVAVEREVDDGGEAGTADLLTRLNTLSDTLLPSAMSSLLHLLSNHCASSSRFIGSHANRQARLDTLVARSTAVRNSLLAAQAERHAQRTALLAALVAQAEAFAAIVGDASRARADADGAGGTLVPSQNDLLKSLDLDEHWALDCPALERVEHGVASLHERLAEATVALDALREQASSSSADAEVRAAVSAADAAADSSRAALQMADAALGNLQRICSSWSSRRDEVLRGQRREAATATAAVVVVADAPAPAPVLRDDLGAALEPRTVVEGAAGEAGLAAASSERAPQGPPSSPSSAAPGTPIVVQPSTPSPSFSLGLSLGSLGPLEPGHDAAVVDDPFGARPPAEEPFALDRSSLDEPLAVVSLRQRMQKATAQEWLDAETVLQLPSAADAAELERLVAGCRADLDGTARLPHEQLLWTDLDALEAEQQSKESAAARVRALARFAERVVSADAALSDLLVAVDDAMPGMPVPSLEPSSALALSLADALVAASGAVTAVRVGAIPVVDDARVARAIERIEESWTEMLGLVEDVRPRSVSAASTSSSSSLRLSTTGSRPPAASRTPSRPSSQASSQASTLSSSVSSRFSSRAASSASGHSARSSGSAFSTRHDLDRSMVAPQTPRARRTNHSASSATPTSSRRRPSGLPVATPRRPPSTAQKPTSTAAHPFSFDTPTRRTPPQSMSTPSNGPDRNLTASTRRASSTLTASNRRASSTSTSSASTSSLFSPQRSPLPSSSSTRSTLRQSTASTRTPSSRSGPVSTRTPRPSTASTTPPSRRTGRVQPYSANMQNKLDREVGSIINALPQHVQVPIRIADGKWSDESGVYNIGGRLYFCRILRSKQVMVRVGGGWLSLLQFLITHFGQVDGLTISPSTSLSKNLGSSKSQWISADSMRSQLSASTSGTSLRDLLASSVSSTALSDLGASTSSTPLRRSLSGHLDVLPSPRRPRGSDVGLTSAPSSSPRSAAPPTLRAPRTARPPVPIWRP